MDDTFAILGQQIDLVLERLSPKTLINLALACKQLHHLVHHSAVWHTLVVSRWHQPHVSLCAHPTQLWQTRNGWTHLIASTLLASPHLPPPLQQSLSPATMTAARSLASLAIAG